MDIKETGNVSNIFDFSVFGLTQNDDMVDKYDREAFVNSLRLWIASKQGDFIDGITRGGYVVNALNKPMNQTEIDVAHAAIFEGLTKDFSPALEIKSLLIEPDFEKRRWNIMLDFVVPALQFRSNLKESIRGK